MQHHEHYRHEADAEQQQGDDGPFSRFAETTGDDLDCQQYAGNPQYAGEDYRGDDPKNEVERVLKHSATSQQEPKCARPPNREGPRRGTHPGPSSLTFPLGRVESRPPLL